MNITQIKKRPLVPSWLAACVALFLLVFGVLPFYGRIVTASGDEVRTAFLQGKKVSEAEMADFITGRETVVPVFPHSEFYNDLALVALDRSAKHPAQAEAFLEGAAYWQKRALSVSPSDPYGWFRLAYIYEVAKKDKAKAASAWHQSYLSAPYEPRLLLPRLGMALRLGAALGDRAVPLIMQLIRQSWDDNPWHLVRAARDSNFLAVAREALKDDAEALRRFDKILKEQL